MSILVGSKGMKAIQYARTFAGYYKTSLLRRLVPNYRRSLDFSSEVNHWNHVLGRLSELPADVRADFQNRMSQDRLLQEPLAALIQSLPKPWRILDVGCGPLSTIGLRVGSETIELFGADPLADTYINQLTAAGISPNCHLVQTDCSDLAQRFSELPFSITCSINALDHAADPLRVIRQMTAVTAPSGYVFLRHAENEGIRERYHGLHQWNFSIRRGIPTLSDGVTANSLVEALPELKMINSHREMERGTAYVAFLFQKRGT
jgi:SAM-dependent methyltransferase